MCGRLHIWALVALLTVSLEAQIVVSRQGGVRVTTVGNLPIAAPDGMLFVVTDAASVTDCTVGGASPGFVNLCAWDADSSTWVVIGDGGGGGTPHSILSATHTDSTAATVQRGDLITGQTATPAWTRLPLGAVGTYPRSDGTDLVYSTIQPGDVPFPSCSGTPSTLTLDAGGAITTTGSGCYFLDTFAAASSDDLVTVNCAAGERLTFAALSDARTIVIKVGAGIQIEQDFSLDNSRDSFVGWCKTANTLFETARTSGGS